MATALANGVSVIGGVVFLIAAAGGHPKGSSGYIQPRLSQV
jgi:hypothetical protein